MGNEHDQTVLGIGRIRRASVVGAVVLHVVCVIVEPVDPSTIGVLVPGALGYRTTHDGDRTLAARAAGSADGIGGCGGVARSVDLFVVDDLVVRVGDDGECLRPTVGIGIGKGDVLRLVVRRPQPGGCPGEGAVFTTRDRLTAGVLVSGSRRAQQPEGHQSGTSHSKARLLHPTSSPLALKTPAVFTLILSSAPLPRQVQKRNSASSAMRRTGRSRRYRGRHPGPLPGWK